MTAGTVTVWCTWRAVCADCFGCVGADQLVQGWLGPELHEGAPAVRSAHLLGEIVPCRSSNSIAEIP